MSRKVLPSILLILVLGNDRILTQYLNSTSFSDVEFQEYKDFKVKFLFLRFSLKLRCDSSRKSTQKDTAAWKKKKIAMRTSLNGLDPSNLTTKDSEKD
jgi:hypothetical protein